MFALLSCTKESDDMMNENSNATQLKEDNNKKSPSKRAPDWGLNNTLFEIDDDIYCARPAANCFDEVVVYGTVELDAFDALNDIVDVAHSGADVQDFFTDGEWDVLFPGLAENQNAAQLTILRSGSVIMQRVVDGDNSFYKVGTPAQIADDEFQFVLQVTIE